MFGGQGGGGFAGQAGGFGGGQPRAKGQDISARTRLSFRDAAQGTEIRLTVDGRSITTRSEERRVGKECRTRWAPNQGNRKKKKLSRPWTPPNADWSSLTVLGST